MYVPAFNDGLPPQTPAHTCNAIIDGKKVVRKRVAGRLHGHLGLQLSELGFLVVLLDRGRLDYPCTLAFLYILPFPHGHLLFPFATVGSRWMESDTGTVPVLSICSSSCSCCMASNSSSSSSSSMGSPIWLLVMALTISSLSAFCSCSWALSIRVSTA